MQTLSFFRRVEFRYALGDYVPFLFYCKSKSTAAFLNKLWMTDPNATNKVRITKIIKLKKPIKEPYVCVIAVKLYRKGELCKTLRVTREKREAASLAELWSNRSRHNIAIIHDSYLFWSVKTIYKKAN